MAVGVQTTCHCRTLFTDHSGHPTVLRWLGGSQVYGCPRPCIKPNLSSRISLESAGGRFPRAKKGLHNEWGGGREKSRILVLAPNPGSLSRHFSWTLRERKSCSSGCSKPGHVSMVSGAACMCKTMSIMRVLDALPRMPDSCQCVDRSDALMQDCNSNSVQTNLQFPPNTGGKQLTNISTKTTQQLIVSNSLLLERSSAQTGRQQHMTDLDRTRQ